VSQNKAFQGGMLGGTNIYEDCGIIDKGAVAISSPIIQNGRVSGVVLGEYDMFFLSQLINIENDGKESYTAIVKPNGDFLVPPHSSRQLLPGVKNVYAAMEVVTFENQNNTDTMRDSIDLQKSGFLEYSYEGESRLVYYYPLGVNDWYIMRVITDQVIEGDVNSIKEMVRNLTVQITFVFVSLGLLVFYLLWRFRQNEKKEAMKMQTVTDNIPGGVAELVLRDEVKVQYANHAFFLVMGISRYEFMGEKYAGYVSRLWRPGGLEEFKKRVEASIQKEQIINFEYQITTSSGLKRWIALNGRVISKSKNDCDIQAVFIDITTERERTDAILEQTRLDPMTGLFNKVFTQQLVCEGLAENNGMKKALVVVDVDKFKNVNDSFGHITGDEAIIGIAGVFKKYMQNRGFAGRIGGDEFLLFFNCADDVEDIRAVLLEIQDRIKHMVFSKEELHITSSMGCVICCTTTDLCYEKIFAAADANLYIAKKSSPSGLEIRIQS
jgi:diguanylate cyclase (GGDEF)-like protein/PAS domain S-box-containing protein